jgi:MYXO-CTERM domain-containing protein
MRQANDSMGGIPADPSGIDEPHDVLAAEEFAMPAPGDNEGGLFGASTPAEAASHPVAIAAMVALLVLLLVALKRRG